MQNCQGGILTETAATNATNFSRTVFSSLQVVSTSATTQSTKLMRTVAGTGLTAYICITYSLRRDRILITSLILLQPHYITDTILQPQAWPHTHYITYSPKLDYRHVTSCVVTPPGLTTYTLHHLQPQTWPCTHHLHCYSHRPDPIHVTLLTSQGMTYVWHYLLCYSHRLNHIHHFQLQALPHTYYITYTQGMTMYIASFALLHITSFTTQGLTTYTFIIPHLVHGRSGEYCCEICRITAVFC